MFRGGAGVDKKNFKEITHEICVRSENGDNGDDDVFEEVEHQEEHDDDLRECEDKKRVIFTKKNGGKKVKWGCKKVSKKRKCKEKDTNGNFLWESCPNRCEGKYKESDLLTSYRPCKLPKKE